MAKPTCRMMRGAERGIENPHILRSAWDGDLLKHSIIIAKQCFDGRFVDTDVYPVRSVG